MASAGERGCASWLPSRRRRTKFGDDVGQQKWGGSGTGTEAEAEEEAELNEERPACANRRVYVAFFLFRTVSSTDRLIEKGQVDNREESGEEGKGG